VRELEGRRDVEIAVLDSSRGEHGGRVADALTALRIAAALPSRTRAADVVTFHASTDATVLFGPIVAAACAIWRRPLVVREFGGSFDVDYEAMSATRRFLVRRILRRAWMLFQTHVLVAHFTTRFPGTRCRWYSNSRPWLAPTLETGPAGPVRRLVFVGHVKPEKGVRDLLAAASKLGARDLHIDVYGPLLGGIRAEEFAGHPCVAYRGVLAPDQVGATLRRYDALVLPTYHAGEGYPGVILEAYVAGLPVIATRWRSIPEIVEDGVSGILIEPRNPDALAAAIAALHDSPERVRALRAGALAFAQRFSSEHWTGEFVAICREVATGSQLRRA
jgi:glycosyltransferase involved in cell wall biosynthesis